MTTLQKTAVGFVALVAALAISGVAYLSGRTVGFRQGVESVRADTLTTVDTVRIVEPVCDTVYIAQDRPVYVPVHDTTLVHQSDTTYIVLPREVRGYAGEDYRLEVSGVQPQLDWVEVYPRTTQVVKQVPTLPKLALSSSVSALLTPEVFGIGAGVQLDVWAGEWQFSPSIDYMLLQHNGTWTHGPAFTFKANYNLLFITQ